MDEGSLFEALENDTARAILVHATPEHHTARELADAIGTSHTTVYRWLERLEDQGLLDEEIRIAMDGNHTTEYRTTFERVEADLTGEGLKIRVVWREDAVDRLTRIWEDIRG